MSNARKLLELTADLLSDCALWSSEPDRYRLLNAINSELANPENDPIGKVTKINPIDRTAVVALAWIQNGHLPKNLDVGDAVYAKPSRSQEPLSYELAEEIFLSRCKSDDWFDLVRAVEKAHGIGGEK